MRPLALALLLLAAGCAPSAALAPVAPTTLLLVRHAERADDSQDSPLSEAGRCRAEALRETLALSGVEAILVSQYRRTHETARSLADTLGLEPRERRLEGDSVEAARALARDLLGAPGGGRVLVVGHSNTVPAMLGVLTGEEPPELEGYGDLFVVTAAPGARPEVLHLRFGDAACGASPP
jgi:broad specificity phosphatase PhoE